MKHKPVKNYSKPNYPELNKYIKNPGLLLKFIPKKWLKNKITFLALITFLSNGINIGCNKDKNIKKEKTIQRDKKKEIQKEEKKSFVAPIFTYGSGSGAIGCIVISPPVFINEAEAIDLIYNELKKNGFDVDIRAKLVDDFHIEGNKYLEIDNETFNSKIKEKREGKKRAFYYDLYIKKYNLGIKYVSTSNSYEMMGFEKEEHMSTVHHYDTLSAAIQLRENLKKLKNHNSAIFYDPILKLTLTYNTARIKSKELLKKQVKEFIKWLRNKENEKN